MDPGAASYIERQADADLLLALQGREYVFLLDSRQKGKSSLVARATERLEAQGVATVRLDLQRFGTNVTPEQWYAGLLAGMGEDLGITNELLTYWAKNKEIGPLARWIRCIRDVVLTRVEKDIVIFVDEIDFVQALSFPTDEFFAGIRECYNRRSELGSFRRITFCLVGVAMPGQLIRNLEITPFNIGKRINLQDFTLQETYTYAEVFDATGRDGAQLVERVHYWVNGHPYLTQLLCSLIAAEPRVTSRRHVDELVRQKFLTPEARQHEPNFSDVERRILNPDVPGLSEEERKVQVLNLYGRVLRGNQVEVAEENPVVATLRLAGVGLEDRHALRLRNRLYGQVFDERWRKQSMPDAELRRQRGAARVAILRAVAATGTVILALGALALNNNRLASDRQTALENLRTQTTQLQVLSGQREKSLRDLNQLSNDLKSVSAGRLTALNHIKDKNRALLELSEQRESALNRQRAIADDLSWSSYVGQMAKFQLAQQQGKLMQASEILEKVSSSPYRGWEWGHAAMQLGETLWKAQVPKGSSFPWSSTGQLVVSGPEGTYEVSSDRTTPPRKISKRDEILSIRYKATEVWYDSGTSTVRDIRDGRVIFETKGFVVDVDERARHVLVSNPPTNRIEVRSLDKGTVIAVHEEKAPMFDACLLPDGSVLSIHLPDTLHKWDMSGKTVATSHFSSFGGDLRWSVSPDGRYFAILDISTNRVHEIRRCSDLSPVRKLSGSAVTASSVQFSNDGKRLLIGGWDGVVRVYDPDSGEMIFSYAGHRRPILSVTETSVSGVYASVDSNGELRVFRNAGSPAIETYAIGDESLWSAVLRSDGTTVSGVTIHGNVFTVDRTTGKPIIFKPDNATSYRSIAVSGSDVFVGQTNGILSKFSTKTLKLSGSVPISTMRITHVTYRKNGTVIFATCKGETAQEWILVDRASLRVISRLQKPRSMRDMKNVIANVSSDATTAIFYGEDVCEVVSTHDGRSFCARRFSSPIMVAAINQDGTKAIASTWPGKSVGPRIALFNAQTGADIGDLEAIDAVGTNAGFSESLGEIGSIINDGRLLSWDEKTRKIKYQIFPGGRVFAQGYSPNGKRLVVSSTTSGVVVCDAKTGEQIYTLSYSPLKTFESPAYGDIASFSKDGSAIVVACKDGAVRIFHSDPPTSAPALKTAGRPAP